MRGYRSRHGAGKPQSIDLERCVELDDRRASKATYDRWAAGKQVEFAFGIEEVA